MYKGKKLTYEIVESGCWEVNSHKSTSAGYFRIKIDGVGIMGHRYMYEKLIGPIPEGLFLRHLCNNSKCVNPEHLKPGTQKENMEDREKAGNTIKGVDKPNCKLTEQQVIEIRHLLKTHTDKEVAKMYNISKNTPYFIRKGEKWKHIGQDIIIPNKCKKLKEEDKQLITNLHKQKKSIREISRITRFNRQTITKIINNDT